MKKIPDGKGSQRKHSVESRFRNISLVLFAVMIVVLIFVVRFIMANITDTASKDYARFYSVETVEKFQAYLNREVGLITKVARSKALVDWFGDEEDPVNRMSAYEEMISYADMLYSANLYFVIADSQNEYSIDKGASPEDFAPFDKVSEDVEYDRWYFDCIASDSEYLLNIDIDKATNERRLWINHKVTYNGELLGVFCSGLRFDEVIDNLFVHYEAGKVRGVVIDEGGYIQMDSALAAEDYLLLYEEGLLIRDMDTDPAFLTVMEEYLGKIDGSFTSRAEPVILELHTGEYGFVSLAPIAGTGWTVVTFFNSDSLFGADKLLPLLITIVAALIVVAIMITLLCRYMIFIPFRKLTRDLNLAGADTDGRIYGHDLQNEFGDVSRTIQNMRSTLADQNVALQTQNSLMSTINAATSILLEPSDDDGLDAINRSMEMVCLSVDADRVCLWQNTRKDDGRLYFAQVCIWTRDGYAMGDHLLEFDYGDTVPTWESIFSEGDSINGPVDTLPATEQITLSRFRLQSVLCVPVFVKGALWGFVSFDDCHNRRRFPWADVYTLSSWGLLVMGAFQRNEIMRDLHIKTAEAEQASIDVKNASEAKSRFIANMSHEIRTPMNAILGITEILIQNENLPTEIEDGLDRIYNSCDLLLGIINDILDFSKIEAGKMDVNPAQYKVASLINDSIQLNMMRIGDKPIEFELHIEETIPEKLFGDEIRIKQILNNLLSNAFKYTDAGKVILSVDSELEEGHGILILGVQDTGHGMSREQLNTMFDEYSRFNQEKGRTIEGTGLGLAILVRLVGLMDGGIHVESEPGVGSHFVVRLPQGTVDDCVLGPEVAENLRHFRTRLMTHRRMSRIVRDPMPYGKILIVDDVETNLYVAVGLMKPYRLQIETAARGQEAIDKIKSGKVYDIIFMDHMMPEMDGIEATGHIREYGYTGTIVALTANAVVGQADIFLHSGFDDFISKPIDVRQLNSALNRYIRDKQPPEVIEAARSQNAVTKQSGAGPRAEAMPKAAVTPEDVYQENPAEWEGDVNSFVAIAHGIKNSLLNIGEKLLSEQELNIDFITRSVHGFLEELRALPDTPDQKREKDGASDSAPATLISDKEIAGLDIAQGIQRYHGDESAYLKVLRSYAASVRSMLDTIEVVAEETLPDYKIKVHGIKGASFDIFAQQIGDAAKELEMKAAAGDFHHISGHNPAFLAAARELVIRIEDTLAAIDAANPKPAKDKPDEEVLSRLAEACKMYDINGVEEAMAEIETYTYESDDGLVDWLRKKVDLMGFADIVEKLTLP